MISGNGWPDVIKVADQTTEHDPLCPTSQNLDPACWFCGLIAKVRADEREYLARVEGWMTPEAHMAVVLDYSKRLALSRINLIGGADW